MTRAEIKEFSKEFGISLIKMTKEEKKEYAIIISVSTLASVLTNLLLIWLKMRL